LSAPRILIADDHPLFRDALKQTLAASAGAFEEAGTLEAAIELLDRAGEFDLVLLDLKMPGVQGFSGLAYLRAQYPATPTAIVSASEEPPIMRRAIDLGASGFIPKSSPASVMREAVAAILAGDVWLPADLGEAGSQENETRELAQRLAALTPQQLRVLMMLRAGLLNKQIAFELGVSEATIKAHVSAILQKLKVDSRTQAVIAANRIDGEMAAGM
jgi:DNA-binding NarL/FixJ family response regulator